MADRKQTPDILGSLLGDIKPEAPKKEDTIKTEYHKAGIPEYHKDSKPVRQSTSKTEGKPTSKPASQKAGRPVSAPAKKPQEAPEEPEKLKATYYISIEAIDALEASWMQLRKMASTDARSSISKSLIVETALRIVLDELKTKGSSSQIARIIKG